MKKIVALILTLLMTLTAVSAFAETNLIGAPNPFTDCETLKAACELAGFEITVPETMEGYPNISYRVLTATGDSDLSMIEIIYTAEDEQSEIRIRKANDTSDISGDYNEYAEEIHLNLNGMDVTLKGDDETCALAIWTNDGYSFSAGVYGAQGLNVSAMAELISSIV